MSDRRGDEEEPDSAAEHPVPTPPEPAIQVPPPEGWPSVASTAGAAGPGFARPLGARPMPDLRPLGEPPEPVPQAVEKPGRKRRPLVLTLLVWFVRLLLLFVLGSLLMVIVYRFVAPPFTLTMLGDRIGGRYVTQSWVPLSRIDPVMPRAAIAAEDSTFCSHSGFDYKAIEAAYARNQQGGRIRGGSTISQQTAKNVFLWQGGGYVRKGLEAWFTFLIEHLWGKRRIMEVYLNVAETGIGTYGVEAGAQRYFRHGAGRMTASEAAAIAAVLPLPKKRAGIAPQGVTRRYGRTIAARVPLVQAQGLDACLR